MLHITKFIPCLKSRKLARRLVYLTALASLWIAIIWPTFLIYKHEIADSTPLPLTPEPQASQFFNASVGLSAINPIEGSFRIHVRLTPAFRSLPEAGANLTGIELFDVKDQVVRLKVPVTVALAGIASSFKVGDRIDRVGATLSFLTGNVGNYPFDKHTALLQIVAFTGDSNVTDASSRPVPMQVGLNGAVPGFALTEFVLLVDQGNGFGNVFLYFKTARSGTTKGFAIFITALSWFLSLIIGWLALQVVRLKRPVEAGTLASPCAMLFALPSLRNVQPGVPGIGITTDIVGFFWNMAIVAMAAITLILYFVLRWEKPASAVPSPDPSGAVGKESNAPGIVVTTATLSRDHAHITEPASSSQEIALWQNAHAADSLPADWVPSQRVVRHSSHDADTTVPLRHSSLVRKKK